MLQCSNYQEIMKLSFSTAIHNFNDIFLSQIMGKTVLLIKVPEFLQNT